MSEHRPKPSDMDKRTIRIILAMVAAGWVLALILMGFAATFWDRQ